MLGRLGILHRSKRQIWLVTSVAFGTTALAVGLRAAHTEASENDRVAQVYLWGDNQHGLIPVPSPNPSKSTISHPTPVPYFEKKNIRDISFSDNHAAAIDSNGNLYQWGAEFEGKSPEDIATLRANGGYLIPKVTLSDKTLISVGCGENAVVALSNQGDVYALSSRESRQVKWAARNPGQERVTVVSYFAWLFGLSSAPKSKNYRVLGIPWNEFKRGEKIVKLSVGQRHAAALTSNGRLLTAAIDCFDESVNAMGQLGRGNTEYNVEEQKKGFAFVPQVEEITGNNKVKDISCGYDHVLFATEDGRAFAFGSNEWEQLGLNTKGSKLMIPTPSEVHRLRLNADGVSQTGRVSRVIAGGNTSGFILELESGFEFRTTGFGLFGQLGNGAWNQFSGELNLAKNISGLSQFSENANKVVPLRIKDVSFGAGHVAATIMASSDLLASNNIPATNSFGGDVYMWGWNQFNQLGNGKINNLSKPEIGKSLWQTTESSNVTGENFTNVAKSDRMQLAVGVKEGKRDGTVQKVICSGRVSAVLFARE